MAGRPSSSPRRSPPAVAWVIVLAVVVGVAAALLSRPVASPGAPSPSYGLLTWNHWGELVGILALLGLGLWLFLLLRDRTNRAPVPGRVVVTILVVLLIGVLFVELAGFVHTGPGPSSANPTGSGGNTSGMRNGTGNANTTLFGTPSIPLPGWVGIAALLGVAILASVVLVPYAIHRAEDRRRGRSEAAGPVDAAREALREALDRLAATDATDARATILALYARLLQIVGLHIGQIDSRTPREIERATVEDLGLRADVARDLREIFEEARYSSHAMTSDAVVRARAALAEAMSCLPPSAAPRS